MNNSILSDIKYLIGGIDESNTDFDSDIIIHINTILTILTQMGVGPKEGFAISSASEKWSDFISEGLNVHLIKSFIAIKVKLVFDPPTSSIVMEAMKNQVEELSWRIEFEVDFPNKEKEVNQNE